MGIFEILGIVVGLIIGTIVFLLILSCFSFVGSAKKMPSFLIGLWGACCFFSIGILALVGEFFKKIISAILPWLIILGVLMVALVILVIIIRKNVNKKSMKTTVDNVTKKEKTVALKNIPIQNNTEKVVCSVCGYEQDKNKKFCEKCGSDLDNVQDISILQMQEYVTKEKKIVETVDVTDEQNRIKQTKQQLYHYNMQENENLPITEKLVKEQKVSKMEQPKRIFCRFCGKQIEAGKRYCHYCGKQITK